MISLVLVACFFVAVCAVILSVYFDRLSSLPLDICFGDLLDSRLRKIFYEEQEELYRENTMLDVLERRG